MGTAPPPPAEDIASLLAQFHRLPPEGRAAFHRLLAKDDPQQARDRFLAFVRAVLPGFIHGSHHDIMAETFERIERGELRRAIINLPPRHTKSMFASVMFPSWYLGRHPDRQIMECSHTVSLAQGFGRQVRNLIATPEYRKVFPGTTLSRDAKAAAIGQPVRTEGILPSAPPAPSPVAAPTWSLSTTRIRNRTSSRTRKPRSNAPGSGI